jgi:hypothetical protein
LRQLPPINSRCHPCTQLPGWAGGRSSHIANQRKGALLPEAYWIANGISPAWFRYKKPGDLPGTVFDVYDQSLVRVPAMLTLRSFSAIAVLAVACVARPTSNVVFEKLDSAPSGWARDDSAKVDKDAMSITLKIHLVNKDMDKFHELAMNVRTTGSALVTQLR